MMNNFKELKQLVKNAYAPYSKFKVAAIVHTDKGSFKGVNVENSSYGATICAERVALTSAIANGAKKFKAIEVLCSTKETNLTIPCSLCLQVFAEFFQPKTPVIVYTTTGKQTIFKFEELLPHPFKFKK